MSAPSSVIISGASTGIGEATVALLARSGYVVFAGIRNEPDAARLRTVHPNIRPVFLEVTDEAAIERAIHEVVASYTQLIGVVSNAGISIGGPLERLPIPQLRRQFEVNVLGALALVQAALPQLAPASGRAVFVGSIAGRLAMPYMDRTALRRSRCVRSPTRCEPSSHRPESRFRRSSRAR